MGEEGEQACRRAWRIFYSGFRGDEPSYTYAAAARRAGVGIGDMFRYAFENGLTILGDRKEIRRNLAKVA